MRAGVRRAPLVALAGGGARRVPGGGRGARPRAARQPPDPRVAVRLGGDDRARRLVRRARRAVADAEARAAVLAAAAGQPRLDARVARRWSGPAARSASGSSCSSSRPATPARRRRSTTWRPTFILIIFWVGLVFVSAIFGDVFRAFSPWRAFRFPGMRPYPGRLGRYPAAVGLFGVHLDRARVGLGRDAQRADHRRGGLHASTRSPPSTSTAPRNGRATARRSASTSACSRASARSRRASGSSACARRSAACRRWSRCPAPCCSCA